MSFPIYFQRHECKTTYQKNCYIETRAKASSVNIEICHANYIRDCELGTRTAELECTEEHDTGKLRALINIFVDWDSFLIYFLFFVVCETLHEEVEVEEEVPVCEDLTEKLCLTPEGETKEICTDVTKKSCKVEKITKKQFVPNTSCTLMEQPRTVCGPQLCPVKKAEPVCEDRVKMVTFGCPLFLSVLR